VAAARERFLPETSGARVAGGTADQRRIVVDDAAVVKATGKALGDWFAVLDERGARSLPHRDIARLLGDEFGVPGWWSQTVTVEYEKHIGRRETGQSQSGAYTASRSRTFPGAPDEVLERWLERLPADAAFDGVAVAGEPAISRTAKWRYWRAKLADGSKVTVTVTAKAGKAGAGGRAGTARDADDADAAGSVLGVGHEKLAGRADAERWKAFWQAYLAEL
jgi:hypothetical protein